MITKYVSVPPATVRPNGGTSGFNSDFTDVRAKGTLQVGGPATFADTISVVGSAKFNGNVSIDGNLEVLTDVILPAKSVSYSEIQDVSATDRLLGRSSAGAGTIEEIVCTAAGRAVLDDVDAAAQRTTLGAAADADVVKLTGTQTIAGTKTFSGNVDFQARLVHTGAEAGFFNAGTTTQPAAIADATNTTDVITQLNALLAAMRSLGLIAT